VQDLREAEWLSARKTARTPETNRKAAWKTTSDEERIDRSIESELVRWVNGSVQFSVEREFYEG